MSKIVKMMALVVLFIMMGFVSGARAGVVAYWDFEIDGGGVLADKANANNLSNKGVTFNGSRGAAVFNGYQTVFSTTNTLDLTGYSVLTIEWFAKTRQTALGIVLEHTKDSNATFGTFGAYNNASAAGFISGAYTKKPGGSFLFGSGTLSDKFVHYAIVIDQTLNAGADTKVELFINYTSVGTSTITDAASFVNDTFYIGSRGNKSFKFAGELDDIRISNTALSTSDMLQTRTVPKGVVGY